MDEDEFYKYDFENGLVISKYWNKPIKSKNKDGYIQFRHRGLDNKMVKAHRILYEKYHNTTIPEGMRVNHCDRNKLNNKIENLELVTHQHNLQHRGKTRNNTSGYKNVHWYTRDNKWQVKIRVNGKLKHFGYFDNIDDAIKRRDEAIQELNAQGHRFITEFPTN